MPVPPDNFSKLTVPSGSTVCRKLDTTASALSVVPRHRAESLLARPSFPPRLREVATPRHSTSSARCHVMVFGDGSESSGVATDWLSIRGHWPVGSFQHTAGPGCTTASGPAVPTRRPLATTGGHPVTAQALRSWAAPPTRCGLAGDPAPWPDTAEPAPRRSGRGAPARRRVIRGARRCGGSVAVTLCHERSPTRPPPRFVA
jgi:hypothetical protein